MTGEGPSPAPARMADEGGRVAEEQSRFTALTSVREPDEASLDLVAVVRTTGELVELMRTGPVWRLVVSAGPLHWELETGLPAGPPAPAAATHPGDRNGPVEEAPSPALPPAARPGHDVLAPVVGVFYRAPTPGAAPFVEIGQRVVPGQQLAIVEAMKMMNAIVADHAGVVTAVHAADTAIVEFEQPLFTLDPA